MLTTDAEEPLRRRALAGDESALEALLGPLIGPGLQLAYAMLGDRGDAEDATQEAATRAWRKLHQLRAGMPIRPWFLAIVANQCRNVRRTRWFRLARVADAFRSHADPDSEIERLDVERGLARLPARDRQALFLHFYLDLTVEEVALALGVSASAARSRIYRACRRLRPDLIEEEA